MNNKKVLFILFNDFTNDSRVLKEATSLVNNNYVVTIFCQHSHGLPLTENINGIKIIRYADAYSTTSENKTPLLSFTKKIVKLKKIFNLLKYLSSNFKDADIIQCHDLVALPFGVVLKLLCVKRSKVLIYDAHEYETEVGFSIVGFKKKMYELIEHICIKFADHILTVSDSIANEYRRKYKLNKIPTVLLNCPCYKEISNKSNIFREKFNIPSNKLVFIYQGGFFEHRGIDIIIAAFRKLKDSNKVVIFMGYGPLEQKIKKAAEEHNNIYYHPAVPPNEVFTHSSSADVGLCVIENSCLSYYYCLPNKFFEYSMAGLPVIVSNLHELGNIINEYNNGVIVAEYSQDCLVKAIESINTDILKEKSMNNNSFNKKYNWEAQEKKLLYVYGNF